MSSITIQQKGIIDIPADAIVNAANSGLRAGGGVCGVIFRRAGERQLAAACKEIGHCPEGSAVMTAGFDCPCKSIIHAVGPVYQGGTSGEAERLYGAYESSLRLCRQHKLRSVVFPLISAGIFGYPVQAAWTQAIRACRDFISSNPDFDIDIIFAIPEEEKLAVGQQVLDG